MNNSMRGFDQQNPNHNETLDKHCRIVNEYISVETDNSMLILSSIYHDNGKVLCQTFDDKGIAHYYNHENIGAYHILSNSMNFMVMYFISTKKFLEMLLYINYHMLPMNWNSEKAKNKWKKIFGEEKFNNLTLFNKCDKIRK